jgi:formiminotetrahydrofolate cyclodeaminase
VAADAAALAAMVAADGSSDSRADSAGAALLAASAVSAAALLIEVNLATAKDDERLARAGELRVAADAAAERARAASA